MKFYEINGKRNLWGDRIRGGQAETEAFPVRLGSSLQLRGSWWSGCDQPHGEREQNCDGL